MSNEDLKGFDDAASLRSKAGQRVNTDSFPDALLSENSSLLTAIRGISSIAKPVRVVAFNKSQDKNWGVPWHQDRVIAVAERRNLNGFENWTQKAGTWHCEPPTTILDQMLFVRVHLDDTDTSNGAMQIALGSHREGVVSAEHAGDVAMRYPVESCTAKRGDVLVLKMLTLHASRPSEIPASRRVFRIDFSTCDLPEPLRWD